MVLAHDLGHLGEDPGAVEAVDGQRDHERTRRRRCPGHLDQTVRLVAQVVGVRAVDPVHGHAVLPRHEAEDLVAGYRHAAAGKLHPDVRVTLHDNAGLIA